MPHALSVLALCAAAPTTAGLRAGARNDAAFTPVLVPRPAARMPALPGRLPVFGALPLERLGLPWPGGGTALEDLADDLEAVDAVAPPAAAAALAEPMAVAFQEDATLDAAWAPEEPPGEAPQRRGQAEAPQRPRRRLGLPWASRGDRQPRSLDPKLEIRDATGGFAVVASAAVAEWDAEAAAAGAEWGEEGEEPLVLEDEAEGPLRRWGLPWAAGSATWPPLEAERELQPGAGDSAAEPAVEAPAADVGAASPLEAMEDVAPDAAASDAGMQEPLVATARGPLQRLGLPWAIGSARSPPEAQELGTGTTAKNVETPLSSEAVDEAASPPSAKELAPTLSWASARSRWMRPGAVVYRESPSVMVKWLEATTEEEHIEASMEITALELFGGGDVVQMLGYSMKDPTWSPAKFRWLPPERYDLRLEAADGDLRSLLLAKESGSITAPQKVRMLVEILRGLDKLARAGWVHRDVRPENILVFGDPFSAEGCHVKLADFHHARPLEELEMEDRGRRVVGSPLYAAPEIWRGRGDMRKVDVWSVGILAFELLTGGLPVELERRAVEAARQETTQPFRKYMPKAFDIRKDPKFRELRKRDEVLANFVQRLLARRPRRRPSVGQALRMARRVATSRRIAVPEQTEVRK